jgi:hypothetical protein
MSKVISCLHQTPGRQGGAAVCTATSEQQQCRHHVDHSALRDVNHDDWQWLVGSVLTSSMSLSVKIFLYGVGCWETSFSIKSVLADVCAKGQVVIGEIDIIVLVFE